MQFHSILFDQPMNVDALTRQAPTFFGDLHLDQVVASITAGREEYDLQPYFYAPLHDVASVQYRQAILRDFETEDVFKRITVFAQQMRRMRQHLAHSKKLHYQRQKERWFLDAVAIYCDAVRDLASDLTTLEVNSSGLQGFGAYLTTYVASERFLALAAETHQRQDDLMGVHYCLRITGNRVTVSAYGGETDYSAEVEATFAKFKQGAVKDYRVRLSSWPDMNHVEARVLELVARLYPEIFRALTHYTTQHRTYLDATVGAFDREAQFYLAYLEYIQQFTSAGLPFCFPAVSVVSKEEYACDTFDLALANTLVPQGSPVVCNDFSLAGAERILVVTGPNQGGKTTFARLFGQLHYLASLGYPAPGSKAQLFLPDQIFTHFEKEEDLATLRGKLEDELIRIHNILEQATRSSVIIMNESFASTTLHDALFLGTQTLRQITELDALGVYVTFLDEVASLSDATVSMVSLMVPENLVVRTYKIRRQPADGLAYAAAIAEKYHLTYESLKRRIIERSAPHEGIPAVS